MKDYAEAARKAKLREWAAWVDSHEERIARAKEALGDKWLLAPCNQVKRLSKPYGSAR